MKSCVPHLISGLLLIALLMSCSWTAALRPASTPAAPEPVSGTGATPLTPAVETTPTQDPPQPGTVGLPTPLANQTAVPTQSPEDWQNWPVVPELSPLALAVLQDGIQRGHNPRAFSKIGDCESQTDWFLDSFDEGEQYYALGPYAEDLAPVITYYAGSFHRTSLAARQGFTAASLMAPIWADRQACEPGETPLACEYRVHQPAVAFIMIGTNDATNPKTFEKHMRSVIETSLEQRVLPILGTKADNIEGDHSINQTLARLAAEYQIPLWNYWRAVQDLPGHGLQSDGAHLTFGPPRFDDPAALQKAWPVRNLNALQVLKVIMEASPDS